MTRIPLIIATRNAHKTQEIAAILPDIYEIKSLADYPDAPEVIEDGDSFAGNAVLKALQISALINGLVLADDSGLCVDALQGAPGINSARYAGEHGNDSANNAKLIQQLSPLPAPYSARFVCAMCLASGGKQLAAFEGYVEGSISLDAAGAGGFGYDPLFIPTGYSESFAILPADCKNSISHRANALSMLRVELEQLQA